MREKDEDWEVQPRVKNMTSGERMKENWRYVKEGWRKRREEEGSVQVKKSDGGEKEGRKKRREKRSYLKVEKKGYMKVKNGEMKAKVGGGEVFYGDETSWHDGHDLRQNNPFHQHHESVYYHSSSLHC